MSVLPTRAPRHPLPPPGQRCPAVRAVVATLAAMVTAAVFALPAAPVPAHAQALPASAPRHHAATDAAQAVPAPSYRNVFTEVPAGVEQGRTDWRSANDEVGRFTRGHIDLLKWEQSQPSQASGQATGAAASPTQGAQGTQGAHGTHRAHGPHGGHR